MDTTHAQRKWQVLLILVLSAAAALVAYRFQLWDWKISEPQTMIAELYDFIQLTIWFTWPAWPLTVWTLWKWRKHLLNRAISRHLIWPLFVVVVVLVSTLATDSSDRTLLLALPALAVLAAFALPTLRRQVSSLIDWFTLLFFTGCGVIIWVIWLAMLTGFPPQPAANVMRLAPGFSYQFSALPLVLALAASLAWAYLVRWRVGRHRSAIWKSLALPAGGATLCWVLLMTLWLPLLDYTQSYQPLVEKVKTVVTTGECIQTQQIPQDLDAALRWYADLPLNTAPDAVHCPWLLSGSAAAPWQIIERVQHPADSKKALWIFRKQNLL